MILKKKEITDELARRCGFHKSDIKAVLDALDKVIVDNLGKAEFDDDVEIHLAKGCSLCSRRVEAREARDPRNQNVINVPEKVIPYADFTYNKKKKINE